MNNLNVLLKFEIAGDSRLHVKGASRIKIDGRGSILLYSGSSPEAETIDLSKVQSLYIQPVHGKKEALSTFGSRDILSQETRLAS